MQLQTYLHSVLHLCYTGIKSAAFVSSSLLKRTGKVDDLIHITDWMPTFIHLAGGKPLTGIDGVNQWPTLSNGAPSQRNVSSYYGRSC